VTQIHKIWHAKKFVLAIDRCEELRQHLEKHQPRHMKAAKTWRDMLGVNCGRFRGILQMVFALELERDPHAFKVVLRQSNYPI